MQWQLEVTPRVDTPMCYVASAYWLSERFNSANSLLTNLKNLEHSSGNFKKDSCQTALFHFQIKWIHNLPCRSLLFFIIFPMTLEMLKIIFKYFISWLECKIQIICLLLQYMEHYFPYTLHRFRLTERSSICTSCWEDVHKLQQSHLAVHICVSYYAWQTLKQSRLGRPPIIRIDSLISI